MASARARKGEMKQFEEPDWDPLAAVVGRRVLADFMWMHEVELRDGTSVHAYKHVDTRRYIHLDGEGQAYVYELEDRYRPVPAWRVLVAVFRGMHELAGVEQPQVEESQRVVERLLREEEERGNVSASGQPLTRQADW